MSGCVVFTPGSSASSFFIHTVAILTTLLLWPSKCSLKSLSYIYPTLQLPNPRQHWQDRRAFPQYIPSLYICLQSLIGLSASLLHLPTIPIHILSEYIFKIVSSLSQSTQEVSQLLSSCQIYTSRKNIQNSFLILLWLSWIQDTPLCDVWHDVT